MGAGRPAVRHRHHLVSDRRRSLYRLHLHRRAGARLRRRRHRVLRRALHHHDLSDPVPGVSAALAGLSQAQLHHAGGFRARPFRQPLAGAGGDHHRHRRDHALHRAATGRPAGGDCRDGRVRHRLSRRRAAGHRLHHSGGLHLFERLARAGLDRRRQGHLDLHHRLRRRHCGSDADGRLRQYLRCGAAGQIVVGRRRPPIRPAPTAITQRWRWARRSRCFFIRTRSPAS